LRSEWRRLGSPKLTTACPLVYLRNISIAASVHCHLHSPVHFQRCKSERAAEDRRSSIGKMSGSMETQARAFADEVRGGLEGKNWMLDLGHPLLNRIAESFVKAAGVSATRTPHASSPLSVSFSRLSSTRFRCFCRACCCRSARSRRSRGSPTSWPSKVPRARRRRFCCCCSSQNKLFQLLGSVYVPFGDFSAMCVLR
jgi:hypothetical protein